MESAHHMMNVKRDVMIENHHLPAVTIPQYGACWAWHPVYLLPDIIGILAGISVGILQSWAFWLQAVGMLMSAM